MFVDEIVLKNFRNYENASFKFDKGINIIYGQNAVGKTNILEAIYIMSTARSHRLSRENEMIRFGEKSAEIGCTFFARERMQKGEIRLFSDRKKQIKMNSVPLERTSAVFDYLNTVMFCPEDLRLIKGSPKERRRMLNLALCRVNKRYMAELSKYNQILERKNILLKKNSDDSTLWVWNERLADSGSFIISMRKNYIDSLNSTANRIHKGFCGEDLEIKYSCGAEINDFSSVDIIKQEFLADLEKNADREKSFFAGLIGPHRDDFKISINGLNSRLYCSQGQQRTATLSIKASELELTSKKTGERAVFLLDDAMSELDDTRKKYILESLKNTQVIITGTDCGIFKDVNKIHITR